RRPARRGGRGVARRARLLRAQGGSPAGRSRPRTSRCARGRVRLAAVGAEADDLDAVLRGNEAVLFCRRGDPAPRTALLRLDDAVALLAEQMVMVRVAAEPVALLGAVV